MYTYKHICIVITKVSNRYNTVPSRKCSCVFSMEGYHNSKFSDPYEQLMWP